MLSGNAWIAWFAFTLAHIVCWISFCILFYFRRHHQPLKNSRPNIILLGNIGGMGFSLICLLEPIYGSSMTAFTAMFVGGTFLGFLVDSYVVFALSLYFAFNKTLAQLELQSNGLSSRINSLSSRAKMIRRYVFLLSDQCAYLFVAVNAVVYAIAITMAGVFLYPESFSDSFEVAYHSGNIICLQAVANVKLFFNLILFAIVVFRIRLIIDETGIKRLMKLSAIALTVSASIFWIISAAQEVIEMDFEFELLQAIAGADAVFVIGIVIPAMRSYNVKKPLTFSLLEGFLRTTNGFAAFKHHLENEFAVENILFWRDADTFKAEFASSNMNFQKAINMFRLYLKEDAPLSVNLDSVCTGYYRQFFSHLDQTRSTGRTKRLAITTRSSQRTIVPVNSDFAAENPMSYPHSNCMDESMFAPAARQLLRLMESDSLPRFLNHPENNQLWQNYLTGINEQAIHEIIQQGTGTDMAVLVGLLDS